MNYAAIPLLLLASIAIALRRGLGGSFAYLYIPVLLLISTTQPLALTPLPDISPLFAIAIGAYLGAAIGNHWPKIRFHWIDALILACSLTMLITAGVNGNAWTVASTASTELLRWLLPYGMARTAFRELDLRRHIAISLSYIGAFMGACGLIEWRLRPLFTSRVLNAIGLSTAPNSLVLGRYGFFRAQVTADHPIDYGNVGPLLAALIIAMAVTSGLSLRDRRIAFGIAGSLACAAFSMSFSSIAGLAVAGAIFLTLRYVRGTEILLVPSVLAAIVGGFAITQHLLEIDLASLPRPTASDAAIDGSFYIRVLIVQNSWNRVAKDAGLFGFGDQIISKQDLGLDSVDNSYMLFLIRRGWVHLGLRLALCVSIAGLGWSMLQNARGHVARTPPAILVAALLGTCASMYTVWFGFVYAELWTAMLAIAVTMRQVAAERSAGVAALPSGTAFRSASPAFAGVAPTAGLARTAGGGSA